MDETVIIVFGGNSWEREGSIISAAAVARSLDRLGISNRLVEFPLETYVLLRSYKKPIVFNCIHGKNGEDGTLSMLCDMNPIPYNFSRPFAHLLGYNKLRFKSLAHTMGIRTPSVLDKMEVLSSKYPLPIEEKSNGKKYILKPNFGGGSLGVQILSTNDNLETVINCRERKFDPFIIEEFIDGKFITCALTGDADRDSSLPLLEASFKGDFFDYVSKHDETKRQYILPAKISNKCEKEIREISYRMFSAMGCDPIVRFDFIVDNNEVPFLLEANTVPGLAEAGNLATIWKSSGRSYDELIEYLFKSSR